MAVSVLSECGCKVWCLVYRVAYKSNPCKNSLHATKPGSTYHFYLKMPCTTSGKWTLLYYSLFLCVCYILMLCRSSLIFDAFQRYTTVAFIWGVILRFADARLNFLPLFNKAWFPVAVQISCPSFLVSLLCRACFIDW